VFHAKGPDLDCGSTDDQFYAFQLSMTAASTPKSLAQLEPVEALYDASGAITGYLAIAHPAVDPTTGQPLTPVPLQKLDATFTAVKVGSNVSATLATLNGKGLTSLAGDFVSLGVVAGNVWLYRESSDIYAVNLTTGAVSGPLFTLGGGDIQQGRAVIGGNVAYVAVNNNTAGSYIVSIDTGNGNAVTQQPVDATAAAAGITLIGETSGSLVYVYNDGSHLMATGRATPLQPGVSLQALTASQRIDSLMGSASSAPAVFLVGDTVFYTVADSTGTFAKQAFYVVFSGTTAGAAKAVAGSTSAVLGVEASATTPVGGPVVYTDALVVTGGASSAGQATFALGTPNANAFNATVASYLPTGAPDKTIGPLSQTNVVTTSPLTQPITGVALNAGPVQAGMPAMLGLIGTDGTGFSPGQDIALYTPDAANSFSILSGFAQ
jgi:hypothetical protein